MTDHDDHVNAWGSDIVFKLRKENERHLWEMKKWTTENFGGGWSGDRHSTWCVSWAGVNDPEYYIWHFKHEQDAVLFALKWMS